MIPCRLIQVLPLLWIHAVTPFPFGLFQPGRIYGNGSSNKKRENSSRQMLSSSYTQLYSPPPSDPPEVESDPAKIPGKTAPISSEYVQAEWKETDDSERLSHIDVISSMTSASNGVFEAKRTTESSSSEEPLKQAHRVQQAYREWCEVREVGNCCQRSSINLLTHCLGCFIFKFSFTTKPSLRNVLVSSRRIFSPFKSTTKGREDHWFSTSLLI